jgi:hypothetical protein
MNQDEHTFWRRMMAADEPTIAEMADAEAQLRQLPEPTQLPTATVAAMVARTVTPPTPAAPSPRRRAHMRLAALAMLAVSVGSVAFVRTKVWLGRNSHKEMTSAMAVDVIARDTQTEGERYVALSHIQTLCDEALKQLGRLAKNADGEVAARATDLRATWVAALARTEPTGEFHDVTRQLMVGTRTDLTDMEHLKALESIRKPIEAGLSLIVSAKFTEPVQREQHAFVVRSLHKALGIKPAGS